MHAYLIANVSFADHERAREYGMQVGPTIEAYGGRYLVRGGRAEVAEGNWQPHHLVIAEFPSLEQARRWYESDEYGAIKPLRLAHADSQLLFVEGIPTG
ncbi:MAG TPA: DUF1330 domain-containing protein [Chloroflexota bacterium]